MSLRGARKAGADTADAVMFDGAALSVSYRLGERENIERSESRDLGLRVLIGKQQGIVSSSDTASRALDELVERAVAMAKAATEDPYCGLADPSLLADTFPDLDLFDPDEPSTESLIAAAAATEDSARAVTGITNSEGASASWGQTGVALYTSHGFHGAYSASRPTVWLWRLSPAKAPKWSATGSTHRLATRAISTRPRMSDDLLQNARCGVSIRARSPARRCRLFSSRASRAVWCGIWLARSREHPSLAAPVFSKTKWAKRFFARALKSLTIHIGRVG